MRPKAVPEKTKDLLKKVLEETDPWTMEPKEMKVWEKILSKEESQMARDWLDKLTRGATYASDQSDLVAADLTPVETRWEKIRWKIWKK
jgi:hypothetical protein